MVYDLCILAGCVLNLLSMYLSCLICSELVLVDSLVVIEHEILILCELVIFFVNMCNLVFLVNMHVDVSRGYAVYDDLCDIMHARDRLILARFYDMEVICFCAYVESLSG